MIPIVSPVSTGIARASSDPEHIPVEVVPQRANVLGYVHARRAVHFAQLAEQAGEDGLLVAEDLVFHAEQHIAEDLSAGGRDP